MKTWRSNIIFLLFSFGLLATVHLELRHKTQIEIQKKITEWHSSLASAFQSGFYFSYSDQFLPLVKRFLSSPGAVVSRFRIVASDRKLLFDSLQPDLAQLPKQADLSIG